MEIKTSDTRFAITQVTNLSPDTPPPVFKLGEILSAHVIAKHPPDLYTVQIGRQALQVRTDQPLQGGETIKLEVTSLGPQLELKPVSARTAENAIAQAVRQLLPQQGPLNDLLTNLAQIGKMSVLPDAGGRANVVTDQLASLARQLLSQLPTAKQAGSAEGLKRILLDSGFFLEHKLLNPSSGTNAFRAELDHDMKAALLRFAEALRKSGSKGQPVTPVQTTAGEGDDIEAALHMKSAPNDLAGKPVRPNLPTGLGAYAETAHALRAGALPAGNERSSFPPLRAHRLQPAPPAAPSISESMDIAKIMDELLRQTESSLSRMQLQQLSTLPTADDPKPVWTFEIPLRNEDRADVIQLRIGQEQSSKQDGSLQKVWSISLAFELEALGPVYANVRLLGQHVTASLWAERSATNGLFREHLETLRRHLTGHGLVTGDINCYHGKPPQPEQASAGSGAFLDTQA